MEASIIEQGKALSRMHGDILDLIDRHGAEFRGIINAFLKEFGRYPCADDLIWIASEKARRDLTK